MQGQPLRRRGARLAPLAPPLLREWTSRLPVLWIVGKGHRSEAVRQACIDNGAVYFVAVGGAAAFLAKCIESCETLAYDDLGTEALRKIIVSDFPVFVGIDTMGEDIYSLD